MTLSDLGAMRMTRTEALDTIKEEKSLTDISIVMEFDLDNEEEHIFFRFYKRYDVRHIASYLSSTKCMGIITGNEYTNAGQGTYSEHTIDIA
eukprot:12160767-Heterocapsa_arctica.AAC.1